MKADSHALECPSNLCADFAAYRKYLLFDPAGPQSVHPDPPSHDLTPFAPHTRRVRRLMSLFIALIGFTVSAPLSLSQETPKPENADNDAGATKLAEQIEATVDFKLGRFAPRRKGESANGRELTLESLDLRLHAMGEATIQFVEVLGRPGGDGSAIRSSFQSPAKDVSVNLDVPEDVTIPVPRPPASSKSRTPNVSPVQNMHTGPGDDDAELCSRGIAQALRSVRVRVVIGDESWRLTLAVAKAKGDRGRLQPVLSFDEPFSGLAGAHGSCTARLQGVKKEGRVSRAELIDGVVSRLDPLRSRQSVARKSVEAARKELERYESAMETCKRCKGSGKVILGYPPRQFFNKWGENITPPIMGACPDCRGAKKVHRVSVPLSETLAEKERILAGLDHTVQELDVALSDLRR